MFDEIRLDDGGKYPVFLVFTQSRLPKGDDGPRPTQHESMGTKPKVWLTVPSDDTPWLLKRGRPGTGEHWAEKIAYEVGSLLELPIAEVQLARWDGDTATVSKGFKRPGQALIHGNELLFRVDPSYPKDGGNYRIRQHTLVAVKDTLDTHKVTVEERFLQVGLDAFGVFIGYLLLDALTCNTDRHHENWACVGMRRKAKRVLQLAPTYDHASSLGRELRDDRRKHLMTTRDRRGDLAAYCARATTALFLTDAAKKPLSPLDAYREACTQDPGAAEYWTALLRQVPLSALLQCVERVPEDMMSPIAKEFAAQLLTNRLLVLQDLKP